MSKNTCFSGTNRHHAEAEQAETIISVQYSHVDDPNVPIRSHVSTGVQQQLWLA